MFRRCFPVVCALGMSLGVCLLLPTCVQAQAPPAYQLERFFYYPYYYFPHNYWPTTSPRWPEPPGMPYMRPPAYMAYPAFQEPKWRYDMWQPQRYHRGFHFWLDQF